MSPPLSSEASVLSRLKRLKPYLAQHNGTSAIVILCTVIGAMTEPAVPALMQQLLDKGFKAGALDWWLIPLTLMGLFALRGLAIFIAQYGLARNANFVMLQLRGELFAKLTRADGSLFAHKTASELANTVVYEVQTGAHLLVATLFSVLKDSLTLIALFGYLLWTNWKLTLVALVIFPGVAAIMKVFSRRFAAIAQASQKATDELAYVVEENVLAQRVVRLHHAEESQQRRFANHSQDLRRLAMKAAVAASAVTPITQLLAAFALSIVISIALWQSNTQGITVGTFAAFITAMLSLIAPIKHLSESASPITRGLVAIERGLDLIKQIPDEAGGSHVAARATGRIVFEHVSVRYPGSERDTLDGIDLTIEPGQVVALVGSSGAGKTTLANLLPRFVHTSGGRITLDGVALPDWNLPSLRQQLAFVSQDVVMFNDTIAANIALGDDEPVGADQQQRIWDALRAANLADFVQSLPLQLDTLVGHNATQLSGGQRQRLAIARAIYKNAPVLILDEATSALDTESERVVQDALRRLMQGRTTLVIAHRLSTIEHADRIVVMHQGRVAETGTHAELMAARGVYHRLHRGAEAAGTGQID